MHKFLVHHTVEQNVHRLCSARRTATTEESPQSPHKGDRKRGGAAGTGSDARQLTVKDVAALLTTEDWDETKAELTC